MTASENEMLRLDLVERVCRDHRNQGHFPDGQDTDGDVSFTEGKYESRLSAESLYAHNWELCIRVFMHISA